MNFTQTKCVRALLILSFACCFSSCSPLVGGSSYQGPEKSIETDIVIGVSCPGELMDQLIQDCVCIQPPQKMQIEQALPSTMNSKFSLSYRTIYTANMNRMLALLEGYGRVRVSVGKQ